VMDARRQIIEADCSGGRHAEIIQLASAGSTQKPTTGPVLVEGRQSSSTQRSSVVVLYVPSQVPSPCFGYVELQHCRAIAGVCVCVRAGSA